MSRRVSRFYDYFFNALKILESNRLAWIDYAKGLTIILVVYHHSFLTLVNSGVKVNSWLINANLSVYSFRMPMFFMLSGVFIAKGLQKRGLRKYIFYRSKYLLYPYLLWTTIQVTSKLAFSEYIHSPWSLESYLVIFYEPNATAQFWYLITLFNTAIVFAIFSYKLRLSIWHQFAFGVLLYMASPFLSFNSMIQDTTRFYVYLVFGSLVSNFILSERNFSLISSPKIFFPLLILMLGSQYYLFKHQYLYELEMNINMKSIDFISIFQHLWGMLKFSAIVMIGCAFMLNTCGILQRIGKLTFIRVIGFQSLYIYILHVLLAVGCRILLVNYLKFDNAIVILPIQIFICIVGSVMIYNVCRHMNLNFLFQYDPSEFKKFINRFFTTIKYQGI